MKIPKSVKRHCPFCNKHTDHKVSQAKKRPPGAAHPLSHGSKQRREFGKGYGNLGTRGSKPAQSKWKRMGKKLTKKTDFRYACTVCKKMHAQRGGIRAKKVELI